MTAADRPSVTDNARADGYCTCNGPDSGGRMGDCGIAAHRAEWAAGRAKTTTACTCDAAPAEIGGASHRPGCGEAETTTATTEDKSVIERAATVIIANTDEPMWSAVVIAKEMASRGLLATARTRPTETEWAVRGQHTGSLTPQHSKRHAEAIANALPYYNVVRREVTAWTEAE